MHRLAAHRVPPGTSAEKSGFVWLLVTTLSLSLGWESHQLRNELWVIGQRFRVVLVS